VKRAALVLLALSLSLSCASWSDHSTVQLLAPELSIEQIGRTTYSGRDARQRPNVGAAPVNLRVLIQNRSAEPITLTRLQLESVTQGAYTVNESNNPFNVAIAPEQIGEVAFWVPTVVEDTIAGAQGPVTLRVVAYFDSPTGQFRKIFIRTVNDSLRGRRGSI
jgi:hypothetical protein